MAKVDISLFQSPFSQKDPLQFFLQFVSFESRFQSIRNIPFYNEVFLLPEGGPEEHRAKQKWLCETQSVTYARGLSSLSCFAHCHGASTVIPKRIYT